MLECRLTPAANYWLGGDGSFTNANNWSDGVPTSDDDLIFAGIPGANPTDPNGVPVGSPPAPLPSVNVTFVSQSSTGSTYSSIHILNGYTGTITIPFNINFGGFIQQSGAINQDSPGQTVANTINIDPVYATLGGMGGSFAWTGGILNNGLNAGKVNIVGMTNATIGNSTNSSYTTGSDIRLLDGTSLYASGSIIFNNKGGMEIGELCSARGARPIIGPLPPGNKSWFDLVKGLNGHQIVKGIGEVLLKGDSWGVGKSELPVWVHGGTLNVVDQDVEVIGEFETDINGNPQPATTTQNIYMTTGVINIRDGRKLTVDKRLTMIGGLLTTQTMPVQIDGSTPATSHVSTIDGGLVVTAGEISLSENFQGPDRATSTLHVTGDLLLIGGVFRPRVYCDSLAGPDRISNDLILKFSANFKISPDVRHKTAAGVLNNGQNLEWAVIQSSMGPLPLTIDNVPVQDTTVPSMLPDADWHSATLRFIEGVAGCDVVIKKKSNT